MYICGCDSGGCYKTQEHFSIILCQGCGVLLGKSWLAGVCRQSLKLMLYREEEKFKQTDVLVKCFPLPVLHSLTFPYFYFLLACEYCSDEPESVLLCWYYMSLLALLTLATFMLRSIGWKSSSSVGDQLLSRGRSCNFFFSCYLYLFF